MLSDMKDIQLVPDEPQTLQVPDTDAAPSDDEEDDLCVDSAPMSEEEDDAAKDEGLETDATAIAESEVTQVNGRYCKKVAVSNLLL